MIHKRVFSTFISCILASVILLSAVSCGQNDIPWDKQPSSPAVFSEPNTTTAADKNLPQTAAATASAAVTTTAATEITSLLPPYPDPDAINTEAIITDYDLPSISAALYDFTDNSLLVSTDLYEQIYPASTTKVLTALFALTVLDVDDMCVIGDEQRLVPYDSSFAGVKQGESMTLEQLLYAMLLRSGNDAAYAVAANCGRILGNDPDTEVNEGELLTAAEAVSVFMDGINDYAFSIGMQDTHFVTPDGYHDRDHYTCLHDLLVMVKTAIDNDEIMKITSTYQISFTIESGRTYSMTNTNALLNPGSSYYMEDAIGLKTGFTSDAGGCVITVAKRNDHTVAALVYRAENSTLRFKYAFDLLNFAWDTIG